VQGDKVYSLVERTKINQQPLVIGLPNVLLNAASILGNEQIFGE
jgi:hypothetical protein